MPYFRHTSPADSPAACSFSTLMICSSVNLLLRMSVSRRNGLYLKSRAFKGSRSHSLADWARRQVGELIMRTVTRSLGLAACACVVASLITVRAEQSCAPKTNAAKILRTKNVNDVDPNWAPPAFIGLSWSLIETKQEGIFLSGPTPTGTRRGRSPQALPVF